MGQKIYAFLAVSLLFVSVSFGGTARRTGTSEQITKYGGSGCTDCGGSGCDYTSLGTWESATDTDHVTDTETDVLECYDDAASFDDDVDLNGSTNNSSFFRIIRAASGEGHDGTSNNGFSIFSTSDNEVIFGREQFNQYQDIIVKLTSNSATAFRHVLRVIDGTSSGDNQKFIGIIVFDHVNNGSGVTRGLQIAGPGPENTVIVLCLFNNGDSVALRLAAGSGNSQYIYNCVITGYSDLAFDYVSGIIVAKNNLVTDNTGDNFDSGTYTGSGNNASDDATSTGAASDNINISTTNLYVNSGSNDFHIQSGATTDVRDSGQDLSVDGAFAFDDDINDGLMGGSKSGELFNVWDRGFDENSISSGVRRIFLIGMTDKNKWEIENENEN